MNETEGSLHGPEAQAAETDSCFPAASFEAARAELERIVGELEGGKADLERAVELWERGEELHRFCLERLDAAEGRIEELARRTARAGDEDAGTVAP